MKATDAATPKQQIVSGIVFCLAIGTCLFYLGQDGKQPLPAIKQSPPEAQLSDAEIMFQEAKTFLPGDRFEHWGLDGLAERYGPGKYTDWTTDVFGFIYFPDMDATVTYDQHTRIIIAVYKGKHGKT